jgi:rhodanese-related sulfurtransferase
MNPAYTRRTCRCCAHEAAENRTTQSVFACVACGRTDNADVHAGTNILARGAKRWREEALAAGYAASACGRGGQTTARRKSRGRSPGEAGTHRSKGLDMSSAHTKACAAGIPVLHGREDVNEDEQDIPDAGRPADIDMQGFFTTLNRLAHARDHIVLCVFNSGRRSQAAARLLRSLGYPKALSVAGGFQAWRKLQAAQAAQPAEAITPPPRQTSPS